MSHTVFKIYKCSFLGFLLCVLLVAGARQTQAQTITEREKDIIRKYSLNVRDQYARINTTTPYDIVRITDDQKQELHQDRHLLYYRPLGESLYILRSSENNSIYTKISPANNFWKMSARMEQHGYTRNVRIQVLRVSDFDKYMQGAGISYRILQQHQSSGILYIQLQRPEDVDQVLACDAVVFVDRETTPPREESPNGEQDLSVNSINWVHHQWPELNGAGMVVSVKEKAFDSTDIDLAGRMLPSALQDAEVSQHAGTMATIIGGAGNSMPESKGVVWKTGLTSSSFSQILPDDNTILQQEQVRAQNHSYGVEVDVSYSAEARAYDVSVEAHPELVHTFSSGNSGTTLSTTQPYAGIPGFANLTGNMKSAKNVLVVTGHYADDAIDVRNSAGPTIDGRLKPEFAAFGPEGTSDAAAVVTGVVMLVQQAYQQLTQSWPSTALVKAVLAATADDIGRVGIDFNTGYGAVNAARAVSLVKRQQYISGTLSTTGDIKNYALEIPAGIRKCTLVLSWIDPAAESGAQKTLVHDLDLTIHKQGSTEITHPWVLSTYAHIDSLRKLPVRKPDHLNNTEYITLENPEAGIYTLSVQAYDIGKAQSFSVAYQLDTADVFHWRYPTASDKLVAGRLAYLRWENTHTGTGVLSLRTNDGSFVVINSKVDLSRRWLSWTIPNVYGPAQLRLQVDGETYDSDVFTIAPSLALQVGYNCTTDVLLQWAPVAGASSYHVYMLKNAEMSVVESPADTAVFIQNSVITSPYFAVAPVFGAREGVRGVTYNYTFQGVNCYFVSFIASATEDARARLALTLSTTYLVDHLEFEKSVDDQYVAVTRAPVSGLNYVVYDDLLTSGRTVYRAVIVLKDGRRIETDISEIYFANDAYFSFFPNPVYGATEELQLLSDGLDLEILFYDNLGRLVKDQFVYSELFRFTVSELKPGLYLYKILRKQQPVASGRIVIR